MSIESMMPSSHLILCRPLHLLPSILPSIRVFPNESALRIRWILTAVRMVNTRAPTTPHAGEDAGQQDPSPPPGGEQQCSPRENSLMFSTKLNTLAYNPAITLLGIYPKELKI